MSLKGCSPRNPPIAGPPIRLAVCVSGGGTTLKNLIEKIGAGKLEATVVKVVASRSGIRAVAIAEGAGISVDVVTRKGKSLEEFSREVFEGIRGAGTDLVILGGFLSLIEIPEDYRDRILNIHPSLLPAFGGKGFHGGAVHEAVLESGAKVSGCTVHFVDDTYDTGPIVSQKVVPVLDDDTAATLAARVFAAECQALPEAIDWYAGGRLLIQGRRVRVLDPIRE